MINQGHINGGEPHWTPEGRAIIEKLVRAAFGKDVNYVPSHHHAVAFRLFGGEKMRSTLAELSGVPELKRLQWLEDHEVEWNHGQNDK